MRTASRHGAPDGDAPEVLLVFPAPDARDGLPRRRRDAVAFPLRAMPMFVLGALARRAGWRVRVVDENREPLPPGRPDLVMIAVWTCLAPSAYELADRYRAQGVPVVLGGVHPSLMPGEALRHADAVVTGEAESVLHEVLADAEAGRLRPLYEGQWLGMEHVPTIHEYRDLYDSPAYRWVPIHSLQTARGCRFNCSFCSVIRLNGRGIRHMEPERAVDEVRVLQRIRPRIPGGTPIFLLDDDLMSEPGYALQLFEALVRAGVKAPFVGQASTGFGRDDEVMSLAARAGMVSVFIGFESMERDSLVEANKKNRPGEYAELVKRIHGHGIGISGGIVFGFDHDRPEVFDRTVEQLERIEVDATRFTALTPLPGTQVFAELHEQGRILDYDWGHYDGFHTVIQPMHMTREQLHAGVLRSYSRWFSTRSRSKRFARQLRVLGIQAAGAFGVTSHRYARDLDEVTGRRSPPFTPHPDDIADLVSVSRAAASDAIGVAAGLARDRGGATPVATPVLRRS